MQLYRFSLFIKVLSLTFLYGCVTERTYVGTDTQVVEKTFDPIAAARERMQLGLTYLQNGNSQQAKYNLDLAIEYAPHLEDINIAMAYYYQKVGEVEKAEQFYINAINANDATGDALNNFGVFMCKQHQYDKAEKLFLEAIDNPKYTRIADSYENLGICSQSATNTNKAKHYFEMALKYEPRRPISLLSLSEIEFEQGNYSAAQKQIKRLHQVVLETAESLALAIKIEQGLNDQAAVSRYGILLLAKFPSSPQAKKYRASMPK